MNEQAFIITLEKYPSWAVSNAFKSWIAQHDKRPTPNHILIRVQQAIKPLTDELNSRTPKLENNTQNPNRCPADVAERIMQENGFNGDTTIALKRFPMSRTRTEALTKSDPPKREHWSDKPNPIAEQTLAQARAKNHIVQQREQMQDG